MSRDSGHTKLSDLNEAWSTCLGDLTDREDMLKGALVLAEKYEVNIYTWTIIALMCYVIVCIVKACLTTCKYMYTPLEVCTCIYIIRFLSLCRASTVSLILG